MFVQLFLVFFWYLKVEGATLWCYKSDNDYTKTELILPKDLLASEYFNKNLRTVIYTFGFRASTNGSITKDVVKAYNDYKKENDINFLLLDWEKEANSGLGGVILEYPTSGVLNAKTIGKELGDNLLVLSDNGVNLGDVHLIAHSLGAHLMGYAGKRVNQKKKSIGRITGLDPAGPLYTGPISIEGLRKGDATFVDIVHSNPGLYGTSDSDGDVDIWTNCDMLRQPGCPNKTSNFFSEDDRCSHDRAPLYFVETLSSPSAFAAVKADNCNEWKLMTDKEGDTSSEIVYMGYQINTEAKGNFYLRTNSKSPYGKGLDGIYP
ncbi:unnamed protein product [Leptosia nina]|uniref:Lipase domain-containing protein n=1 Tax=Leptosia nina TaxID=320188 RepID=A0AAV1JKF3_9NEOP